MYLVQVIIGTLESVTTKIRQWSVRLVMKILIKLIRIAFLQRTMLLEEWPGGCFLSTSILMGCLLAYEQQELRAKWIISK